MRVLIVVIIFLGLFYSFVVRPDMEASCIEAGGKAVIPGYAPPECWSPDGSRRLFVAPYFD